MKEEGGGGGSLWRTPMRQKSAGLVGRALACHHDLIMIRLKRLLLTSP